MVALIGAYFAPSGVHSQSLCCDVVLHHSLADTDRDILVDVTAPVGRGKG